MLKIEDQRKENIFLIVKSHFGNQNYKFVYEECLDRFLDNLESNVLVVKVNEDKYHFSNQVMPYILNFFSFTFI